VTNDGGATGRPQGERHIRVCPRVVGRERWPSRRPTRRIVYAWSRPSAAPLSFPTTEAPPGPSATAARACLARIHFANLIVDPKNPQRGSDHLQLICHERRRQELLRRRRRHPRRSPCRVDRSHRTKQWCSLGDDGGLWISYDGANRGRRSENLPISAILIMSASTARTLPGLWRLQDNSVWVVTSAYPAASPTAREISTAAMASGRGPIPPRRRNFAYVESQAASFSGSIARP